MGEPLEYGQHPAGKIKSVEVEVIRRVAVDQGVDDCLQQGGLACYDLPDDRMMAACVKADPERDLGLVGRIVDKADHCVQRPLVPGDLVPAAVVEGIPQIFRNLVQADRRLQRREPQAVDLSVALILCDVPQIFLDHIQLGLLLLLIGGGLIMPSARTGAGDDVVHAGHGQHPGQIFAVHFIRIVDGSAEAGLELLVDLIVADLQIAAARLRDKGGVGLSEHIHTVFLGLHAQAEAELRVGGDVFIDRTCRSLRGQDQVDTQASSDLGDADELLHEVGLLPLQLCELIDDNEQVGDGLLHFTVFVEDRVLVDVVDAGVVEHSLTAAVLALDRNHGAADLGAGQVGDGAQQVREAVEEVGHAAALVVDDEKADVIGAVFDGQREQVGLQGLGFTGTCRACHQSVGTVVFLMDIHVHAGLSALDAQKAPDIFIDPVLAPELLGVEIAQAVDTVHLKEGHGVRNLSAVACLLDPHAGDRSREPVQGLCLHGVEFHFAVLAGHLLGLHDPAEEPVVLEHIAALVGQVFDRVGQNHGRESHFFGHFIDIMCDQFSLDQPWIGQEQDVVRHPVPVVLIHA